MIVLRARLISRSRICQIGSYTATWQCQTIPTDRLHLFLIHENACLTSRTPGSDLLRRRCREHDKRSKQKRPTTQDILNWCSNAFSPLLQLDALIKLPPPSSIMSTFSNSPPHTPLSRPSSLKLQLQLSNPLTLVLRSATNSHLQRVHFRSQINDLLALSVECLRLCLEQTLDLRQGGFD